MAHNEITANGVRYLITATGDEGEWQWTVESLPVDYDGCDGMCTYGCGADPWELLSEGLAESESEALDAATDERTEQIMTRRILTHYNAASSETRALGAQWYADAMEAARIMDPENPTRAAGVIAALSPRAQWKTNLAWAQAMIIAADAGEQTPPRVHTTAMRKVAWSIATGAQTPEQALKGPKILRFYRNITGDQTAVTVDVWAARAAEGSTPVSATTGKPIGPKGKRYDAIERAYRNAARRADTTPAEMQAAVWIHVRGRAA